MKISSFCAVALLTMLTACGGGNGGMTPAASTPSKITNSATATLKLTIPTPPPGVARSSAARVHPQYVSYRVQSVTIAGNGVNEPNNALTANVTPTSPGCSGTPVQCTIQLATNIGVSETFTITSFAGTNGNGAALGTATVTQAIGSGNANTIAATLVPYFEFPVNAGVTAPYGIIADPSGSGVWISESATGGNSYIAHVLQSGSLTSYAIPTSNATPEQIALGSDGALWFVETTGNKIGRIATGGAITEYAIPTANADSQFITAGPDGNLWFTEETGNKVGRITPSGAITEYAIPTIHDGAAGIVAGSDGALWFAAYDLVASISYVGRVTTAGAITLYTLPTATANPGQITKGPDGNLWITEQNSNAIAKVVVGTPPTITEYSLPPGSANPFPIAPGPDGNVWFGASGTIGEITTSGTITEYQTVYPSITVFPANLAFAADGNLWFSDSTHVAVGYFAP